MSGDAEEASQRFRDWFAVVKAISRHAEGQSTHRGDGFISSIAIGHDTGHGFDISPPSPVIFPANSDWD